jgi:hypothetical protein
MRTNVMIAKSQFQDSGHHSWYQKLLEEEVR